MLAARGRPGAGRPAGRRPGGRRPPGGHPDQRPGGRLPAPPGRPACWWCCFMGGWIMERLAKYFVLRPAAHRRGHVADVRAAGGGDRWEPLAFGFLLVLFRCAGLFMVAPIFGAKSVPPAGADGAWPWRWPSWPSRRRACPASPPGISSAPLLGAVVAESLIGLSAGLAARFCIEAAAAAGHAAGLTMGIGFCGGLDPIHGADSTALSELLLFAALGAALAAGPAPRGHRLVLPVGHRDPAGQRAVHPRAGRRSVIAEAARGCCAGHPPGVPGHGGGAVRLRGPRAARPGRARSCSLGNIGFAVALLAGGVRPVPGRPLPGGDRRPLGPRHLRRQT